MPHETDELAFLHVEVDMLQNELVRSDIVFGQAMVRCGLGGLLVVGKAEVPKR